MIKSTLFEKKLDVESQFFFSLHRDRCTEKCILYAITTFSLPTKSWFWIWQLPNQWVVRVEHLVSDSDSCSSITYGKVSAQNQKAFKKEKSFLIARFSTNEASVKEMGFGFRVMALDNL